MPDFEPGVVARCRKRYGLVLQAVQENSTEIALAAYEYTLALPQTETELQFRLEGYTFNGAWNGCEEKFIICFQDTLVKLLKVLSSKEFHRASVFLRTLQGQPLSELLLPSSFVVFAKKTS